MTPFLESHSYVTSFTWLVTRISVPLSAVQLIRIVSDTHESIVGVGFRHHIAHPCTIEVRNRTLIMSMKGGVTPPTDNP